MEPSLPSLNASQYPRTYRLSPVWMAIMLLFGVGAIWVGAYFTWLILPADLAHHEGALIPTAVSIFITLFGVWVVQAVPKYRMVLYADRIELHELLRPRTLLRDDILGRRVEKDDDAPGNIILVPRGGGREVRIESSFWVDEFFWKWINTLPDLDAEELYASREEILGAPEGTPARAERMDALDRARSFSRIMIGATIAAGAWAWFFPQVYSLALLACVPWLAVAIVARSEGLFRIVPAKNDAHPNMTVPFVAPGVVLVALSFGFHLLDWQPLLMFAAGTGTALWMAAAAADSGLRKNRPNLVFMLLFAAIYGYGASREANAVLDRTPATVYRPAVIGKHTSTGKHTSYYLDLGAWGPDMRMGEESVPSSLYQFMRPGDRVCVMVKQGALRAPWYTVTECNRSAAGKM
jgi:hypothetical protein